MAEAPGTAPAAASGISPTTLAVTSGVSTGVQIVGQIYAAIQAQKMGRYNAGVARANAQAEAYQGEIAALQQDRLAQIAAYDITLSEEAAAFREARLREQDALQEGQNLATIGASGLALVGSPLAVLDANARQAELAVLVSRYTTRLEQRASREEIVQHQYAAQLSRWGAGQRLRLGAEQADLARYEAGSAASAAILGAGGDALTGAQRFETARRGLTDDTSGATQRALAAQVGKK